MDDFSVFFYLDAGIIAVLYTNCCANGLDMSRTLVQVGSPPPPRTPVMGRSNRQRHLLLALKLERGRKLRPRSSVKASN